jgi:hypothetical protein
VGTPVARFKVPHISDIYSRDAQLGIALQAAEDAINQGLLQVAASGQGSTNPPANISSLSVSAANGVFDFAIVDHNPVLRGINYFVEYSTTPSFTAPHVIDLGASRNFRTFLDSGTYYFRAYSAYPTSARSSPVYFGSQSNPTAVNGGGAVAGPAPLASQGSGTSSGANGGDGGFGNDPVRGNLRDLAL